MSMRSDEITNIIKSRVEGFVSHIELDEVGEVISVGDGIVKAFGLNSAIMGELVKFESGIDGMVMNIEMEGVGIVVLGDDKLIKEGHKIKRTGKVMEIGVGEGLIGRIVDPLSRPIDGKGEIKYSGTRPVEVIAPGIVERQPVRHPLYTGIKAIDGMIPIGRGQRELIIGDRQTGKTAIAIDTIINQKREPQAKRPICIYVAIGQREMSVARIAKILQDHGAMEYTIIVAAFASDPAPLLYLSPYSGCTIGEYFMWKGKDVLVIYDDLSKHAQAYRQMSLLLRRPPGREAYPGDVFYLHSRLLERACKLNDQNGGGSLTALPIIETQANDVSAYIPTNVISITDGQIYLEPSLFYAGIRPAINVGISVSRVGGSAQVKAMRQVAGKLRIDLAQYNELQAFAQFASDLDKETLSFIRRGQRLVELLKQNQYEPLSMPEEVIVIYAGTRGYLDDVELERVKEFEIKLLDYIRKNYQSLIESIETKKELTPDIEAELKKVIEEFKKEFTRKID